ncbi:MAG: ABC transporter permease, partial [Chitinivibrionales bacterium]|nr:ABC transporter permease [Chitinivibrionales bacterium]MBD3395139.1 ABC transporter permease [Chitinivibrionales bacterium]
MITAASIFFAVILVMFTRSMQLGSYEHIVHNALSRYTGFVQVHGKGFWDDRSLDRSMAPPDTLRERIASLPHVTHVVPRLETFALASSGARTRGTLVMGIDPRAEQEMNQLDNRLVSGEYLKPGEKRALIEKELARYLRLTAGDTLLLIGQGYYGSSAAGAYVIAGIVDVATRQMGGELVYLPLREAQWMLSAGDRITSLSIMIDDSRAQAETENAVRRLAPPGYEVMGWREMLPEMVQWIEIDNAGGVLMLAILYIVVGFGMFGT